MDSVATVLALSHLFTAAITVDGGHLLIGDVRDAKRHEGAFARDPVGFEAFVNHFHLLDLVGGTRASAKLRRKTALFLGEALVKVWSERLSRLELPGDALFLLGGRGDVVLRCYCERPGVAAWIPLGDTKRLKYEGLRVFRVTAKSDP